MSTKPYLVTMSENDHNHDVILLPTHIRVEKEGKNTRVFCSETGAELSCPASVKLDLSDGKIGKAKLTFECEVTAVEIIDSQMGLPGVK